MYRREKNFRAQTFSHAETCIDMRRRGEKIKGKDDTARVLVVYFRTMSKFYTDLDSILYSVALDGSDDVATWEDGSSRSLVLNFVPSGKFSDVSAIDRLRLCDEEFELMQRVAAFIVLERGDGVVMVSKFENGTDALAEWNSLLLVN